MGCADVTDPSRATFTTMFAFAVLLPDRTGRHVSSSCARSPLNLRHASDWSASLLFVDMMFPPMRISVGSPGGGGGGFSIDEAATICCISAKIALADGEAEGVESAGGGRVATIVLG